MRVMILSGIRLYRDGLADVLAKCAAVQQVEAASPGPDALAKVATFLPDIVLIDSDSAAEDGLVRAVSQIAPRSRVVALGVSDREDDIVACAEAGVAGFVSTDASLNTLLAVCESALRDELLCSPRVAALVLRRCQSLAASSRVHAHTAGLTDRELEILELIDTDLTNKQIAGRLNIEVATVKNHVHNILDKLRVRRRREAAALARTAPRWQAAARRLMTVAVSSPKV